jgi:hypothetical protein
MLDLLPHARGMRRKLGRTLAVDSTLCETHHRSRHYERRLSTPRDERETLGQLVAKSIRQANA